MHADVYNGRNTVVGCCCILFAVPCVRCHTTHTRLTALYPGLPGRAGTRKVKTNLDFSEARDSEWAICKSAPRSRQITTPAPHHSVFTDRMPFLPPNQQRQSTEGTLRTMSY